MTCSAIITILRRSAFAFRPMFTTRHLSRRSALPRTSAAMPFSIKRLTRHSRCAWPCASDPDRFEHAAIHFLGGLFFGLMKLAMLAVAVYLVLTLFQLITLPVEFDASRRAKIILQQMGIIRPGEEAAGIVKCSMPAALTYVAAFVASLGTLLHFLLMVMNNRDR